MPRWMAARLAAPDLWRSWVAEPAGALQGMAWLQVIEKMPNPVGEAERHGYVTSVFVRPPLRGQGTGSAFLEACLHACDQLATDSVILWPTPLQPVALRPPRLRRERGAHGPTSRAAAQRAALQQVAAAALKGCVTT